MPKLVQRNYPNPADMYAEPLPAAPYDPKSVVHGSFLLNCPIFFIDLMDYLVLVSVQCHDVIITTEINLFGLARVKDECKTQKKIYRVCDNPIMTLDEDQNIFLVTSLICSLKN